MFGSSLFALQTRRRSRTWFILPLSIFLHLVAFATFVGAQYWSVAEVPEPDLAAVFYVALPPPPPAAAPPGRPQTPVRAETPRPQPVPLAQPEPEIVQAEIPQPSATDELASDAAASHDGPGIDGGTDPDGSQDGLPGVPPGPSTSLLPGPAIDDGQPIPVGGAVLKPEIIPGTRIPPRYTEAARRARLTGSVLLEAIIDAQGNVTAVRVVKPLPLGLDQEAVKAVQQWKFRPGTLHGRPVAVYFRLTVTFQVQN